MSRLILKETFLLNKHLTRSITTSAVDQGKPKDKRKSFNDIPGPKPLPLIGNIWRYLPFIGHYKIEDLYENALYNRKKYGPLVKEVLLDNHVILHLFDPKDIESFFRQDNKYPHRRSHRALLKYRKDRPNLYRDGGLFPENGENWYRQRSQFNSHLMAKHKLAVWIDKLDEVAQRTVEKMEKVAKTSNNGVLELENYEQLLYRWALSNTFSLFLDLNLDDHDESFINETMQQLHNSLTATEKTEGHTNKWMTKPDKCPYYTMLAKSQEFLYSFVERTVDHAYQHKQFSSSYLNEWLHKEKFDRLDIISFVIDFLMAGFHTSSYMTAFNIYFLAKNPAFQKKLRDEVDANFPDVKDESLEMKHIEMLSLMRNCLKETNRLNPVSIGTGRVTCNEVIIRNHRIPPGIMVIAQNQVISRDEKVYEDANKFIPERWAKYRKGTKSERPSAFATLPFGFGPRACLGQRLVELQVKVFLGRLLQRFELVDHSEIRTKTTLIHVIDNHLKLELSVREK